MNRRGFLAGAGASLAAALAGCLGEGTGEVDCSESLQDDAADSEEQFLQEGHQPESDDAEEFLATVAEVTGGRTGFEGRNDTWRIGFGETDEVWTIRYSGNVGGSNDRFREEIVALATAFAAHRPDGVSLKATANHECTTGTWHVCADTAAAYERGELDRETFVERVQGTVETINNC
ncbi:MAG: hypothetical protein V5A33_04655 [Halobacteriales archaeon]